MIRSMQLCKWECSSVTRAISGAPAASTKSWFERATHKSELSMKKKRFKRIMVNETVCVRVDGREHIREVRQQFTQNVNDSNVCKWHPCFRSNNDTKWCLATGVEWTVVSDEVVMSRVVDPKF